MNTNSSVGGNRRIDGGRLWESLMDMAMIGATARGGVHRISFTPEDRQARETFTRWCEAAGCTVKVDVFGNMFSRREGRNPELAPVLVGSHLDSQPTGGKFDGALGVLSGLEIVRTLNDTETETERAIEVVNWTNEEGAIFKPMIGSEVFTGFLALEDAYAMPDPDGNTLEAGLERIGHKGSEPLWNRPIHSYFEAHIEQGPVLEEHGLSVGVVTGAFAQRWYTLALTGLEAHAGPTPMKGRRDALMGASEIALALRAIALGNEGGRGTIGCLTPFPASPNVIPGRVELTIDTRHADEDALIEMGRELREAVSRISEENGLEADLRETVHIPYVPFHADLVAGIRQSAEQLGVETMDLVSGAGHDAVHMAKVIPSAMVFVMSENGISHNEMESSTKEDCAAGCDVLFQAVLAAANNPDELEMPA